MNEKLISVLKEVCSGEEAFAIVTIINVRGSTPRKAGTKMIITRDGQAFGTIGGGCGEAEVKREALNALDEFKSAKYVVNMTQDLAADEGMVCGGVMEVFIDIFLPTQGSEKYFMLNYIKALENNEEPLLITVLQSSSASHIEHCGRVFITSTGQIVSSIRNDEIKQKLDLWISKHKRDSGLTLVKEGDIEAIFEPAPTIINLVIMGGGHIALPLCSMAKILGYHVTVIDDRPLFANKQRFALADKVICNDFLHALADIELSSKSFIIIVTRGHRHDKQCLRAVVNRPNAYIGMIGSKRRVKALMAEMHNEGIPHEALTKVHSPIGVDIGAQTPEEIAVSILAEVIKVQRILN